MPALEKRIDALRRLAILGIAQQDDPAVKIIAEEILRYVASDDGGSLDDALQLAPSRGEATWKTVRSRIERNIQIRIAAQKFYPDLPPRSAARTIHAAWDCYVHEAWPRDRNAISIPVHLLGTIHEPLFLAMKAWPATLSPRQIEVVLSEGVVVK